MNSHNWKMKKSNYYKKKPAKKQSAIVVAKRALNSVKRLQKGNELKYVDTTISDTTIANTGYSVKLTTYSQGVGDTQYIGDKLRITSVRCNFQLDNVGSSLNCYHVRILIVKFKDPSLGVTLASVLEDATSPGNIYSLYEKDVRNNYKILYDKTVKMKTAFSGGPEQKHFKIKKSINSYVSVSQGVENNDVYLFVVPNNTTELTSVVGKARIHFKEA